MLLDDVSISSIDGTLKLGNSHQDYLKLQTDSGSSGISCCAYGEWNSKSKFSILGLRV